MGPNAFCHWIQKDVIIQDYKDGGLRNLEYRSFMIAQKIVWLKRLVNNPNSLSAEFIAEYLPKQDCPRTVCHNLHSLSYLKTKQYNFHYFHRCPGNQSNPLFRN